MKDSWLEVLLLASQVVVFPTATRRIGAQGKVARECVFSFSKMQKTLRQTDTQARRLEHWVLSLGRIDKRPPGT